jgi:hypothetical protein
VDLFDRCDVSLAHLTDGAIAEPTYGVGI